MYDKRVLVCCAAMLLLATRGIGQTGPHPLLGTEAPASAAKNSTLGGNPVPATPSHALPFLTAIVGTGEEIGSAGAVRWSAGVIEEGRQSHVEHTFTFKNKTAQAVTVSRLRGSCGCETLFLTKGGKEPSTVTLAPGEAVGVRVSVALRSDQSGEMHKYAWAYGPEASSPPLGTMEIALAVRPPVVFAPSVLDFGPLSVGVPKSLSVTVTADASALAGKPLPTPVASSNSVTVTPDGAETSVTWDGKPAQSRRFRVTLSGPVESGPLSGSLSLPAEAGSVLTFVHLPLAGAISGTMTAQPGAVYFGSIPAGQGVSREVLLSETAAQRGQALSVSSASPWLTAEVQAAAGTKPLLVVTLKPGAPTGALETKIVVTSASGERLIIPVVGEILGHHS